MHECPAVSFLNCGIVRTQFNATVHPCLRPVFAVNGTKLKHSLATSKILRVTRAKRKITWHFLNVSL